MTDSSEAGTGDDPLVSVVMPVRNGAAHLDEAIASILDQTLTSIELIVVDNGSTDGTSDILARWAASDRRVVPLSAGDIGLVRALNVGMERARAPFVARMDADDIAEPCRLERQLSHLASHSTVAAVGTGYRYIGADGAPTGRRRTETGPHRLRAAVWFGNPIAHPSVMFAIDRLESPPRYDTGHPDAEDLELWLRLMRRHELDNLTEPLLRYRKHATSVTAHAPDIGRRSAVELLVREAPWSPKLTRWIADGTYDATNAQIWLARFLAATAVLNVVNLARPAAQRRALAWRSLGAAVLAVNSRSRRAMTTAAERLRVFSHRRRP